MDEEILTVCTMETNSQTQETSDPVCDKLMGLNERLEELLLELGELSDYMPDKDDVENLGKPHTSVKLKPTKDEIKQKQMQIAQRDQFDNVVQ